MKIIEPDFTIHWDNQWVLEVKTKSEGFKTFGYYTQMTSAIKGAISYRKNKKYKFGYSYKDLQFLLREMRKVEENMKVFNKLQEPIEEVVKEYNKYLLEKDRRLKALEKEKKKESKKEEND